MRRLTTPLVADAKAATLPGPATAHGSRPVDVRIAIEVGITSATADGASSDVEAGVGGHPAVFGWGMSDQGCGSSPGTPDEEFARYVEPAESAHRIGGVNTGVPVARRHRVRAWPTRPRAHPSSTTSARDEVTGAVSIR